MRFLTYLLILLLLMLSCGSEKAENSDDEASKEVIEKGDVPPPRRTARKVFELVQQQKWWELEKMYITKDEFRDLHSKTVSEPLPEGALDSFYENWVELKESLCLDYVDEISFGKEPDWETDKLESISWELLTNKAGDAQRFEWPESKDIVIDPAAYNMAKMEIKFSDDYSRYTLRFSLLQVGKVWKFSPEGTRLFLDREMY